MITCRGCVDTEIGEFTERFDFGGFGGWGSRVLGVFFLVGRQRRFLFENGVLVSVGWEVFALYLSMALPGMIP